jgi:hypothetical protein
MDARMTHLRVRIRRFENERMTGERSSAHVRPYTAVAFGNKNL